MCIRDRAGTRKSQKRSSSKRRVAESLITVTSVHKRFGRKRVLSGDLFFAKRLVEELPAWFDNHVNGMDAALAFHLNSVGYDVDAGGFGAHHDPAVAKPAACS